MLKIKKFLFNPFSENTFLISDELNNVIIIDPGCYYPQEEEEIDAFIKSNDLKPIAILHTHSHLDHMFGTAYLASKYNIDIYIHQDDEITYSSFSRVCDMYGIPIKSQEVFPVKHFNLQDGYSLGDHHFIIKHVPGHAPGHVVFYNKENKFVINGDCLFQGSIGRTDLPGGNHEDLIKSIKSELFTLPEDTVVYCGHGPETTIGVEKQTNPFF